MDDVIQEPNWMKSYEIDVCEIFVEGKAEIAWIYLL